MNLSRNDPCPCGSGLKFKRCCGKIQEGSAARAPAAAEADLAPLVELFYAERYAELEHQTRLMLAQHPESGMLWKLLGTALGVQGKDALPALEKAAARLPDDVDVHNNLGNALQDLGQYADAVTSYRRALAIKPDFASAQYNLGICLVHLGQLDEAVASYHRALEIKPDYAEAHSNLGNALRDMGQFVAAVASFRQALALQPDGLDINRGFLSTLLYLPGLSQEVRFNEHLAAVARLGARPHKVERPFPNFPNPRKKLRIGYVSSDFRTHPVGRNIKPLIECHDRSQVEIYLYGDVNRHDGMTEWFRNSADQWRSIKGLNDGEAAELIRRDEVDILVLLASRFDGNRPLIAAYRAAPVQVSFHDPATSGLVEMDYLITDHNLSPRGAQERFTERLVRLPTFYVHEPMNDAPGIGLLPQRQKGHVTFGSFNNPAKVNESVVALWSRVLKAMPGSRLLLKYKNGFGVVSVKSHYLKLFESCGIPADRLMLVGADEGMVSHLSRYAEIDIALDTFPFTGSTTTFEALWMGVPVVTLLGDHMVARWSGAMLKKLKLDELIAQSEDQYVKIAQGLAQDPDRLASLRAGLRERVAKSPLCDEKGRARQIERAYRWMWAKWCAGQVAH